jgi:hypothetical protein
MDRERFPVTVGATLRVFAPRHWPLDVTVRVGEEYEAIVVEAGWTPGGGDHLPPTLAAAKTDDGDVDVRLTPPHAQPADAADTAAGRGWVRCLIPPRFCGVDIASGGGEVRVDTVVESHVSVDSGGGHVTLGSIKGARLRVTTGGGFLAATTLVADSTISTHGGEVTVGKLVGRFLTVRTRGGDMNVGALFAGDVTVDTAGGALALKTAQVSGVGRLRSRGGAVSIRGLAGDGEEHTVVDSKGAGDSRGGDVALELHERLSSLCVRTGGGDVALTVPEGFAPQVTVHGTYRGTRVRGPISVAEAESGDGGSASSAGGHLRMVGGTGDEAARKVAAVAGSAAVILDCRRRAYPPLRASDTLSMAEEQAPGLGDVCAADFHDDEDEEEEEEEEERDDDWDSSPGSGDSEAAGQVTIQVKSWFASVMAGKGFGGGGASGAG